MSNTQAKKDYITKIISVLRPMLSNYDEIFSLVTADDTLDITLDAIINILNEAIKKVKNQRSQNAIVHWIEILKKIQHQEEIDEEKNKKDLDDLEKLMED